MRIFAMVTDVFGAEGGIAQSNTDLFEALSKEHEIVIFPRKAGNKNKVYENVTLLRPSPGSFFYSMKALFEIKKMKEVDAIFCGHIHMAPLAFLLSRLYKVPFWLHIHGIEAWQKKSYSVGRACEKAALVTAVSRYTRRRFLTWAVIAPEKVRVLPNTVSHSFKPGPKNAAIIKRFHLEGKKILLTVGRLSAQEKYKGHDKVISVLPEILKSFPQFVYLIVGDGGDKARLKRIADEKNVSTNVLFAGQASNEELPDYFRIADLFVMPSTGEGFGIVFLQAASCGVPIIGGNADGSMDVLEDERVGKAVDSGNAQELAATIISMLSGSSAQPQAAIQKFSKEKQAQFIQELVAEL
jgi:phosphatidyl-myo-inositol dimannoside synthase